MAAGSTPSWLSFQSTRRFLDRMSSAFSLPGFFNSIYFILQITAESNAAIDNAFIVTSTTLHTLIINPTVRYISPIVARFIDPVVLALIFYFLWNVWRFAVAQSYNLAYAWNFFDAAFDTRWAKQRSQVCGIEDWIGDPLEFALTEKCAGHRDGLTAQGELISYLFERVQRYLHANLIEWPNTVVGWLWRIVVSFLLQVLLKTGANR